MLLVRRADIRKLLLLTFTGEKIGLSDGGRRRRRKDTKCIRGLRRVILVEILSQLFRRVGKVSCGFKSATSIC